MFCIGQCIVISVKLSRRAAHNDYMKAFMRIDACNIVLNLPQNFIWLITFIPLNFSNLTPKIDIY